jgi:hypothetical protein
MVSNPFSHIVPKKIDADLHSTLASVELEIVSQRADEISPN